MSEDDGARAPFAMAIEYRSASSFLMSYSMNLSRGGLFLETPHPVPIGAPLDLALQVPGAGPMGVQGQVAWRRERGGPDGPAGLGIALDEVGPSVGVLIDRLVSGFHGIHVLVMAGDAHDRAALTRLVRSVVASAEFGFAGDAALADLQLTDELDLAIIELDGDPEGGLGTLRRARSQPRAVPVIALGSTPALRERARTAGADEVVGNPPTADELRVAVVRALGRPLAIRGA